MKELVKGFKYQTGSEHGNAKCINKVFNALNTDATWAWNTYIFISLMYVGAAIVKDEIEVCCMQRSFYKTQGLLSKAKARQLRAFTMIGARMCRALCQGTGLCNCALLIKQTRPGFLPIMIKDLKLCFGITCNDCCNKTLICM